MKIEFCDRTGLLYVDGVAFTTERIKYVLDLIDYGNKNQGQFEYGVTINDSINEAMVLINNKNVDEFLQGIAKYSGIASDNDFN